MIFRHACHTALAVLALYQLLPLARASAPAGADAAAALIEQYRQGAEFDHRAAVAPLVTNHQVDPAALALLARALRTEGAPVRDAIVRLLEQAALAADRPAPDRYALVRDRAVIGVLLTAGFARDDSAANEAARVLLEHCMPRDLAAFNAVYLSSLRQGRTDYIALAARAKTPGALQFVERIARHARRRGDSEALESVRLAQAALGDTGIESTFMRAVAQAERDAPAAPPNRFYDNAGARDGTALAERLDDLGRIGTRRSLAVVCRYLRSPLKTYVPDTSESSVRHAAAHALLYNFPNRRLLSGTYDIDGWRQAERFCTRRLGVVFVGPTPDMPPPRPYPHF